MYYTTHVAFMYSALKEAPSETVLLTVERLWIPSDTEHKVTHRNKAFYPQLADKDTDPTEEYILSCRSQIIAP
jgi:hypothetical protein